MKNKRRILSIKAADTIMYVFVVGIFFLTALPVSYLLFWPQQSYVIQNFPTTTKDQYYPGEVIEYTRNICAYKSITFDLSTQLVDGSTYSYPTERIHREPGCKERTITNIIVPITQKPGVYHLEFNIRNQVNIIRSEDDFFKSNEFQILPIPEDAKQTIVNNYATYVTQEVPGQIVTGSEPTEIKPAEPEEEISDPEVPKKPLLDIKLPFLDLKVGGDKLVDVKLRKKEK